MSGSINRATLLGHLGKDVEVRSTQNGQRIASFSVATSETWKDRNSGERKERTHWHNIVVFEEALVGIAEKYLRKGSKVLVEGQIETRKWEDKSGTERYTTEIVLKPFNSKIVLLDSKAAGESGGQESGTRSPPPGPDLDEEAPF